MPREFLIALYYNEVMIGTVQTVNLSANYGTLVRGFSTLAGNDPGQITVNT